MIYIIIFCCVCVIAILFETYLFVVSEETLRIAPPLLLQQGGVYTENSTSPLEGESFSRGPKHTD